MVRDAAAKSLGGPEHRIKFFNQQSTINNQQSTGHLAFTLPRHSIKKH
jgi:hypothetical protein